MHTLLVPGYVPPPHIRDRHGWVWVGLCTPAGTEVSLVVSPWRVMGESGFLQVQEDNFPSLVAMQSGPYR